MAGALKVVLSTLVFGVLIGLVLNSGSGGATPRAAAGVSRQEHEKAIRLAQEVLQASQRKPERTCPPPAAADAHEALSKEGSRERGHQAHESEVELDLPMTTDGARYHRNKCFKQGTDRMEVTSDVKPGDKVYKGVTVIARDVCAMGHTPKDLAHIHSWQAITGNTIDRVLFGQRCMTRDANNMGNRKRTPVFHNVLKDWFTAILGNVSETVYYEDAKRMCFELVVERDETWRWFRSVEHASSFRRKFLTFFGVAVAPPLPPRGKGKARRLNIIVLRRDEDRHFREEELVKFLTAKYGEVADVKFHQFDNPPNGPPVVVVPPYREQVQLLAAADVLIAAHGAALSSVVAMRPGASVIELFPHNFRYYMYEELAKALSLNYVAFEGQTVAPPKCCKGRGEIEQHLKEIVHVNGLRECKKCDIAWDEPDMYYLVKNALASVWLRDSRRTDVHDFDVRR